MTMLADEARRRYLATSTAVRLKSVGFAQSATVDAKLVVDLKEGLLEVDWTPVSGTNAGKIACDSE
jgi:hypothetical protein